MENPKNVNKHFHGELNLNNKVSTKQSRWSLF